MNFTAKLIPKKMRTIYLIVQFALNSLARMSVDVGKLKGEGETFKFISARSPYGQY
jgi:hypothetical protein